MTISLTKHIDQLSLAMPLSIEPIVEGRLTRMVGLTMEAVGCRVKTGDRCSIQSAEQKIEAEVIGFDENKIFLMPTESVDGLMPGSSVLPIKGDSMVDVGPNMLGRIFNGAGEPLDDKGPVVCDAKISLHGTTINPLKRHPIRETLNVGVKAINGLMTVGRGQRMGLFAGSGVGKSVLLGMMTRYTDADVTVVGLIGERGREVKEFIEDILAEEGLARSVVVASPADDAPLMRLRAAMYCTAIAEYFRSQGKNVLLLMDSLTRFAQAQREIALAVGEPPATKGYPPSVFAKLPKLVERAGNAEKGEGSITAFYTVLTEGDDLQDPIADAARAILDGHVVLSRRLAEEGHYPAIDIESSISRAMPQVVNEQQLNLAQRLKQLYSYYQQNRDLISVGAYQPGSDKLLDQAVERLPYIQAYLQQKTSDSQNLQSSQQQLQQLMAPIM